MFGVMADYYYYTRDPTYNQITTEAFLFQTGPNNDYMTPNQTNTEGNDDQGFWGMAVMSAAEQKFPDPPADKPQWLALAQGVFNTQAARWDKSTCGGGLRWQIFPFNNGYNYKNSISNGAFFNLGARLAVYTGNDTYADWAEKTWDWVQSIGLMSPEGQIFDGSDDTINCTEVNHLLWSYNAGIYLLGAANMYSFTNGSALWADRVELLLNATTSTFFSPTVPNVMFEAACEPNNNCNVDQQSFKAHLSRSLAATTLLVPSTAAVIMPLLSTSAAYAAQQCSGPGPGGSTSACGLHWTAGAAFDGKVGVGQQMAAMEVIMGNLIGGVEKSVTNSTGGTSLGDSGAGGTDANKPGGYAGKEWKTITGADRVGAGFITVVGMGLLGWAVWFIAV
ncbi:hydrolase 76 protein [Agyrium rufum]|nr:hydrolase 76 protein [Agyrium rufum]